MLTTSLALAPVPHRSSTIALVLAIAAPVASIAVALASLALGANGEPAAGFTAPVTQLILLVALMTLSTYLAVRTLTARNARHSRTIAIAALTINATLGLASLAPLAYLFATLNQQPPAEPTAPLMRSEAPR